ncbi:MAG: 4'-phosphopantetheinyl transferase family protein [Roseiarcus sp.]
MTAQDCGVDLEALGTAIAHWGVRAAARRIQPGDENAIDGPARLGAAAGARRRASGAARIVARALLDEIGVAEAPLRRLRSGAPQWPPGIVGSLAHDDAYALAAVARRGALENLGVDIEPAEPLPVDVIDFALLGDERRHAATAAGRLVFAAKEAVYKAMNPLEGAPLEYSDIAVDLDAMTAALADGRRLRLFAATRPRLVAAALYFG